MWATPMVADGRGSAGVGKKELPNQVKMWPTPSANQQQGGITGLNGGSGASRAVHQMVGREIGLQMTGGSLNPDWVSAMMGYPPKWTEVD